MLMSLAGIPLTADFIAKYYIVLAGAGTALWLLLITLIVTSVVALFATPGGDSSESEAEADSASNASLGSAPGLSIVNPITSTDGWLLAVLLGLLRWVGVFPQSVLNLISALPLR